MIDFLSEFWDFVTLFPCLKIYDKKKNTTTFNKSR